VRDKQIDMKRELKHLAPYLPYGLKVYYEDRIAEITSFYLPSGKRDKDLWIVSLEDTEDDELSCSVNFKQVKPLLHPLSSLTKEIEHNGEKFIPLDRLTEIFGGRKVKYDECCFYVTHKKGFLDARETTDEIPSYFNQLDAFNKLFEWHIDLFGLIDEGLAVEI